MAIVEPRFALDQLGVPVHRRIRGNLTFLYSQAACPMSIRLCFLDDVIENVTSFVAGSGINSMPCKCSLG